MASLLPRALIASMLLIGGLTGCADSTETVEEPEDAVVVDPSAGSVSLEVGETLVVDFGTINTSVGDDWDIAAEPDPEILTPGEYDTDYLGEEGSAGGSSTATYTFEAVGEGETTIELQYSYRGSTADADVADKVDDPAPSITVTVTAPPTG